MMAACTGGRGFSSRAGVGAGSEVGSEAGVSRAEGMTLLRATVPLLIDSAALVAVPTKFPSTEPDVGTFKRTQYSNGGLRGGKEGG